MTADVSIIVPCRNEEDYIDHCLASVLLQEDLSPRSEVLVIDGESDDRTGELVAAWQRKDKRVRLIPNPKRHVSAALNLGIDVAENDLIIRMDAHTHYASDYVKECIRVLEKTGAKNVGGPARTNASGYVQEAIRLAYHHPLVVGGSRFHNVNYEGPVDTVTYGCWRKSTLLEIGGFDERLIRNQDDELNFRINKAGGIVWQSPSIRSWYWPRSTLRALAKQYFQYGYWKAKVIEKHRQPASIRHVIPVIFVTCLALAAITAPFFAPAAMLFIALGGCYAFFVVFSSLAICMSNKVLKYFPILPIVIACYQLPYGFGILLGWTDSIFRRSNRSSMSDLSR